MIKHSRILGLITARGGSKGLPRKNIRLFCGKPLVAWTIEVALESNICSDVVVSTDDEEIADCALDYGASVPFMRPAALASDSASSLAVVFHALKCCKQVDSVLLMQPTSPLRSAEDVRNIVELGRVESASSAVSVTAVGCHPSLMYELSDRNIVTKSFASNRLVGRRQDFAPLFALNGALYLSDVEFLTRNRNFIDDRDTLGYRMPRERSVDIDDEIDWKLAELLMRERIAWSIL